MFIPAATGSHTLIFIIIDKDNIFFAVGGQAQAKWSKFCKKRCQIENYDYLCTAIKAPGRHKSVHSAGKAFIIHLFTNYF